MRIIDFIRVVPCSLLPHDTRASVALINNCKTPGPVAVVITATIYVVCARYRSSALNGFEFETLALHINHRILQNTIMS